MASSEREPKDPDTSATLDLDRRRTAPASLTQIVPGLMLGDDCELIEEVTQGGMSVIWKGRSLSDSDELVAIKFPKLPGLGPDVDQELLERFLREIAAHRKAAGHPNLPTVLGANTDSSAQTLPYYVMPYYEGTTLASLNRKLDPRGAIPIAIQVCRALQKLHSMATVHRDVKPKNILLSHPRGELDAALADPFALPDDAVKLIDLGLVLNREIFPHDLTRSWEILGSPNWQSPEQWKDSRTTGPATDIFSFGLVLHLLLTGENPFKPEEAETMTIMERMRWATESQPRVDAGAVGSPELVQLLKGMLEVDPARRPNATSLSFALERLAFALGPGHQTLYVPAPSQEPSQSGWRRPQDEQAYNNKGERNYLWPVLARYIQSRFGAIHQDPTMLQDLYLDHQSAVDAGVRAELLSHLRDERIIRIVDKSQFQSMIQFFGAETAVVKPEQVLLVEGPIGVGKTTFIHHLVEVKLPKARPGFYASIIVDCLRYAEGLRSHIFAMVHRHLTGYALRDKPSELDRISAQLEIHQAPDTLRALFRTNPENANALMEAHGFLKRIEGDIEECVADLVAWLRDTHRMLPLVVIDNVDQLSSEGHEDALQCAMSLVRLGCLAMVCMRDTTLVRSRVRKAIGAMETPAFPLRPPSVEEYLETRFHRVVHDVETWEDREVEVQLNSGILLKLPRERLVEYLRALSRHLTSGQTRVGTGAQIVGRLANFNFRRINEMIRVLVESSALLEDTDLTTSDPKEEAQIPLHRLMGSLILAGYEFYCERSNPFIVNLFQNDRALLWGGTCWIRYRILYLLCNDPMVSTIRDLTEALTPLGYLESHLHDAIRPMAECGLVEFPREGYRAGDGIAGKTEVKATTAAVLYLDVLCSEFVYVQHMRDSCYMPPDYIGAINAKLHTIEERIEAAALFVDFLEMQERREIAFVQKLDESQEKKAYPQMQRLFYAEGKLFSEGVRDALGRTFSAIRARQRRGSDRLRRQ